MMNYKKAPKLYHVGNKGIGNFYLLPQQLMNQVFNQLDGKSGNQIKLISVLLGTKGDGSFTVSEKWICDRTGMGQSSYNRARTALIEKGWLKLENGKLKVLIDKISENNASSHAGDMPSDGTSCGDSMPEACAESMHNKERINKNNIKEIDNGCSVVSFENRIGETEEQAKAEVPEDFTRYVKDILNLDFKKNTATAIEEIIGEKIHHGILRGLISSNMRAFITAKRKGSNYVYGMLLNKVREEYNQEKAKHEALIQQQERDREQWSADAQFRRAIREMHWPSPPKEESNIDILQMLQDEEEEEKRLAKLKAEEKERARAAELAEVDFDSMTEEEHERYVHEHVPEELRLLDKLVKEKEAKEAEKDLWAM